MSENSETEQIIYLHVAKIVTDKSGYIYNPDVLQMVQINDVVRISFEVDFEQITYWNHDSPYVKIINRTGDEFLGEIQNINRIVDTNSYPLGVGERIRFNVKNIIEIPGTSEIFANHVTGKYVPATGPLFTIQAEESDDSDSASENSNAPKTESANVSDYTDCSDSE